MKNLLLAISVISALMAQQAKADVSTQDDKAFQLGEVSVTEVVPTAVELYSAALQAQPKLHPEFNVQAFDFSTLDWNQMVLIGQKIVEIVKAGAPVINLQRDLISVVPSGITSWEQLSGWQVPVTKVFEVAVPNGLGMEVVKMRLKVSAMYGGGIDGRGQYLANVLLVPSEITVLWGFGLDVWSENRPPVNMGTLASPKAGLGFDIRFKVTSYLSQKNATQDYFITGAGEIIQLQ